MKFIVIISICILLTLTVGVFLTQNTRISLPFLNQYLYQARPAECKIYAVSEHKGKDSNLIDSQFISIDPISKEVLPLGSLYKGLEFEGIDVHPTSQILYADLSEDGKMFKLDAKSGGTREIGTLDFTKINSLAFHPKDNTLWGWAEERGLVRISPDNASTELIMESIQKPVGLTWNSDGTMIYASIEDATELYTYNPNDETFTLTADNLPENTEGLATLPDNLILGANSPKDAELFVYIYDPKEKKLVKSITLQTTYYNLEGITWPLKCGMPF